MRPFAIGPSRVNINSGPSKASLEAIKIENSRADKISKLLTSIISWCEYLREHSRVEPHLHWQAIRDSASPWPKVYWTLTFEGLVPSLGTTSNGLVTPTSFYLFSGKLEYLNKIIRFNYLYCPYENESLWANSPKKNATNLSRGDEMVC